MQPTNVQSIPTTTPTTADIRRVWRADGSVRASSAVLYFRWVRRFRSYCTHCGLDERSQLTLAGTRRFIAWYIRRNHVESARLSSARSALYSLTRVYQVMRLVLPPWEAPARTQRPRTVLLRAYANHLVKQRGNPPATVRCKLRHVEMAMSHLALRGKTWRLMTLHDIDLFLMQCSTRYARTTTAGIASSVRSFARFLFATERVSVDLADSILAPVQPKFERARRALPWEDVQRLLRGVDTSSGPGLRDHALLLMMSTYGFGAAEVTGLRLQDIDWSAGTIKVLRPKTGVAFTLPLLPSVAKVLARYLRHARPPDTPTKHVFVRMKMPFGPFTAASAVRHVIVKHAKAAGIDAPFLGSHVLRHSNAARQIDVGTRPRVLSDLLGHRDPESVSAYVRVATESLRDVSLPVPV